MSSNQVYTVGRAGDNTVVLESPDISRYHLKITEFPAGILVEDLGSRNGTYHNGVRIQKLMLQWNDTVHLGSFRFPLSCLRSSSEFAPRITLEWGPGPRTLTIGRDGENDIVLPYPQVSKSHARIFRIGSDWMIKDLKSTNGTFVNGLQVKTKSLKVGDEVRIASYIWEWEAELSRIEKFRFQSGLAIVASGISVVRDERIVLDDISLSIDAGKMLAIVGPSGSGKSTLLNVLRGVLVPKSGRVSVNGKDLRTCIGELLGQIGYVPQDDIIHRELTVLESLYYAARLRLPDDTLEKELKDRVNEVIRQLGLKDVQQSRIGTPERRGISGGERKRVNVAQELITEPAVLFLDEPTSGLDPQGNNDVIRILRGLSDKGKTIVLSTHNVSHELFLLIDRVVVLAKGKLVYFGRSAMAMDFFGVSQPTEIFRVIKDEEAEALSNKFRQSLFNEGGVESVAGYVNQNAWKSSPRLVGGKHSSLRQMIVLVARNVRRKIRDEINFVVLLLQAPVIGALIGLVLRDEKSQVNVLFLMDVAAVWFGCLNAAREVVAERGVYLRERLINLEIPVYLASKFVVLAGISTIQCALLVWTVAILVSFKVSLATMFGVLLLSAFGGIGLGLCISSLVNSTEAAIAMTPLVLIPQIVLGGIIKPLSTMGDFFESIAGIVFSRWGSEALIGLNHPELLKHLYGISAAETIADTIALAGLTLIFFFFAGLCLRRLDPY